MQYKIYVTAFDYINKILIVLSATSSRVSIISFTSIAGAPVGIESASLTLIFSLTTGIVKQLLNITRNKNKKESVTILKEKDKYEKIKKKFKK